eukprot:GHUV01040722.1.p1 GENE.GHUV01040722.1~~GHUV01040722.1.p1  ORF type:complete len:147 (-),score=23.73 GHUV01040722.1:218-658(-)
MLLQWTDTAKHNRCPGFAISKAVKRAWQLTLVRVCLQLDHEKPAAVQQAMALPLGQVSCRKNVTFQPSAQHHYKAQPGDCFPACLLLWRQQGIIYRDVKPDNFLFLTTEEDSPLKATDFGLSIRHYAHEPKLTSRSGGASGDSCHC